MLSQLKRDKTLLVPVVLTFFSRGIAAFGTLALSLVLARYANASELGLFMLGLSIMIGLGTLSRLGMDNAMLRFGGVAVKQGNFRKFRGLQRQSLLILLLFSLPLCVLLMVFSEFISDDIFSSPDLQPLFLPMALVLPAYSLIYMQGTWLKALRRPALAPLFETGAVAFITAAAVLISSLIGYEITALTVSYLLLLSTLVVLAVGRIVIARVKTKCFPKSSIARPYIYEQNLRAVLPDFFMIAMTGYLVQSGALLVLGAYESSEQVGLYSTAHRLAFVVNFILLVFNSVLAPKFASLYASGDLEKLDVLVRKSTLYMTFFSLPIVLLLFAFAGYWLSFFGSEFVAAAPILMILVVAQLVNVATGSVSFLLSMTGHQRVMRNVVLMTGVVTIGMSLLCIPYFGIWGALIANATALVMQNLVAAYKVNKLLGIRTIPGWNALSGISGRLSGGI
jgi:O-antigen/teichoic acid export membrane protein